MVCGPGGDPEAGGGGTYPDGGRSEGGDEAASAQEGVGAAVEFVGNDQLQELQGREVGGDGLMVAHGEGLNHAGEAQGFEVVFELGVHEGSFVDLKSWA